MASTIDMGSGGVLRRVVNPAIPHIHRIVGVPSPLLQAGIEGGAEPGSGNGAERRRFPAQGKGPYMGGMPNSSSGLDPPCVSD